MATETSRVTGPSFRGAPIEESVPEAVMQAISAYFEAITSRDAAWKAYHLARCSGDDPATVDALWAAWDRPANRAVDAEIALEEAMLAAGLHCRNYKVDGPGGDWLFSWGKEPGRGKSGNTLVIWAPAHIVAEIRRTMARRRA